MKDRDRMCRMSVLLNTSTLRNILISTPSATKHNRVDADKLTKRKVPLKQ